MHCDYEELLKFLKSGFRKPHVVVMPDFFLDRLINLKWDAETFSAAVKRIILKKGGSIDGIGQVELRGGNAVNAASALAALGAEVTPIVCTSKLGLQLLKFHLEPYRVDTSHVKVHERSSVTTAIEFKTENGKANVMLRDLGSLANFGPSQIDERDFKVIEEADYVCVFNWAGTRSFGTKLAETVFRHAKTKGRGRTYYDTADPTPNEEKISSLVKNVLQSRYVDILSVNENEATRYASQIRGEAKKLEKSLKLDELALESARVLAAHLNARVDLHTTTFSATLTKTGENIVPAFEVPVLRATGAGDAWNAGNILGDFNRLSNSCRLALANAVAAYYISSPDGLHPTPKELLEFCEKMKRKDKNSNG
ncbi:MAG: carbohydrate kinase family protein [Candidatus Bathycorpusculaceae bacterium]